MLAFWSAGRAAVAAALVITFTCGNGVQGAAPPLEYVGSQGGPGGAFDVLADGRLIGMNGESVFIETAVGSGQFMDMGSFDAGLISEFGASFVSVSPDGSRFVVGDGRFGGARVYEVALADLNGGSIVHRSHQHENYAATWYDNDRIAISAADPNTFLGEVRILELASGASTRVVSLDGASGGVAFDASGNLFTANGYDFIPGGSATGEIRALLAGDIAEVLSGQRGAIEFATSGQFIGQVLSGSDLGFDAAGHLFIGGGDIDRGAYDYFAVAEDAAVQRALAGMGALDWPDLFVDDPDESPFSFYSARYNALTGEWLVASGSSSLLYRYAPIPAPGALLSLGAGLVIMLQRRRRDGRAS